jgi:Mlc titration factor MtfA (ptsG expression regulator)
MDAAGLALPFLLWASASAAAVAAWFAPSWWREHRRARLRASPFVAAWRHILRRRVPAVARLPVDLQLRLKRHMQVFLAEKVFLGCQGQAITDEVRVTIAAQACLLLLGRPGSLYDELQSILVYPSAFWVEDEVHDDDGLVTQRRRELSGEAWDSHRIILSWEDIEETARRPADGYNVVLHEFAHYLDAEGLGLAPPPQMPADDNARSRGPPERSSARAAKPRRIELWHADLVAEYAALCDLVDRGEATFLDPYAAEDEAEFFAVVTEEFIECSAELREAHPRLYSLLREFYGIDPASWNYCARGGAGSQANPSGSVPAGTP